MLLLRFLILLQLSLLFGLPGGAQVALRQVCDFGCEYSSFAAALSVSMGGDEIMLLSGTLNGEPSVNITFPLTITAPDPVHIYTTEAATGLAWLTVSSTLKLSGNFTVHAAALHVVAAGSVIQQGALTISVPYGIGVRVEQGCTFLQQGALVINAPNNQTVGVFCLGEWQQLGSFQANSSGHQYPCLVMDMGCLHSVSAWVYLGRWTQNGTVEIRAIHVAVAVVLAEWIQNAPVSLTVIADEPPTSSLGSVLLANSVWKQSAALEVAASQRSAIYLGDLAPGLGLASLWQQDGSVKLLMTSPFAGNLVDYPYVGVEFNGSILWNQNADVAIILETPATTKAFNCKSQPSWNVQKGNLSISPSEAFSLDKCVRTLPFVSNVSTVSDSEQPALRFDTTSSALQIVPKAVSEQDPNQFVVVEEATVGLGFASITEVADNGTHLQTGHVAFGSWSVLPSNSLGASQAFVFKAVVAVDNQTLAALRPPCTVEMEVFLFDEATNVTIGDLASFTVLPALTKVALRVSLWPWLSASDNSSRLEVRLAVSPAFTNVTYPLAPPLPPVEEEPVATKRQGGPSSGLTSLLLSGQRSSDGKRALTTEVRFVSVVELDGVVQAPSGGARAPVEFDADVESSSLVLSFGYFATNMSYDPDLGVLVGRRDRDGSSTSTSDDDTWVIAVSIAVPLAVVAVVAVIAVGLVALALRKRRRAKGLRKMLSAARADDV